MSVRTGFFSDGTEYFQPDFAAFLKDSLADGYVLDFENELEVIASTPATMTVEIQPGRCWVQGYFGWVQDANEVLTVAPNADAANAPGDPRIDRIVARLSVTTDRKISFEVLQGTPGAVPVAPALTRTDETYEISLAQIAVAVGATSIATGNITDERGDVTVCGIAGIKHDWRFAAERVRIEVDPADVNVGVSDRGVSDRDPVYWDGTEWNVAGAGNPPQGYYDDANSGVVTHGYLDGFVGLTPGAAQDYGIALSATEVYVSGQYSSEFAYTYTRTITPAMFETYSGTIPVGLIPADSTAEMIISVSEAFPSGLTFGVGTSTDPDAYFSNAPIDAVGVVGVAYKGVDWGTVHAADTPVYLSSMSIIGSWTAKNNLNTARYGLAGCGTTSSALCMGGYTGAYSAATEQWDGTNWTAKNNLNTARSYLAGCGTTASALCMGGTTGADSAVTEQWDGTNWTAKNNLNTARRILAGCGTTPSALCMGGYTSTYSAATEQWDGIPDTGYMDIIMKITGFVYE